MSQGEVMEDCSTDDFFGQPESRSDRACGFLAKILIH